MMRRKNITWVWLLGAAGEDGRFDSICDHQFDKIPSAFQTALSLKTPSEALYANRYGKIVQQH